MSLVEQLFKPDELEAMRQAVINATYEPASKRRKIDGTDSFRNRKNSIVDSAYGSEEEKSPAASAPSPSNEPVLGDRRPSLMTHSNTQPTSPFSPADYLNRRQSPLKGVVSAKPASFAPLSPRPEAYEENGPEYCCQQIALARARLYQSCSSMPSPPDSQHGDSAPDAGNTHQNLQPIGCIPPLATSEFPSFVNSLNLCVTSHEKSMLRSLFATAPSPPPPPQFSAIAPPRFPDSGTSGPSKRRRTEPAPPPRTIYQGFAISAHCDESDEEEDSGIPEDAVRKDDRSSVREEPASEGAAGSKPASSRGASAASSESLHCY